MITNEIIKQQREVEAIADIPYQMFFEKISFSDFYWKHVLSKFGIANEKHEKIKEDEIEVETW